MSDPKPYGHVVTVRLSNGETAEVRRVGRESVARRAALLMPHAVEVERVEALTEENWVRAYGRRRRT